MWIPGMSVRLGKFMIFRRVSISDMHAQLRKFHMSIRVFWSLEVICILENWFLLCMRVLTLRDLIEDHHSHAFSDRYRVCQNCWIVKLPELEFSLSRESEHCSSIVNCVVIHWSYFKVLFIVVIRIFPTIRWHWLGLVCVAIDFSFCLCDNTANWAVSDAEGYSNIFFKSTNTPVNCSCVFRLCLPAVSFSLVVGKDWKTFPEIRGWIVESQPGQSTAGTTNTEDEVCSQPIFCFRSFANCQSRLGQSARLMTNQRKCTGTRQNWALPPRRLESRLGGACGTYKNCESFSTRPDRLTILL